MKAALGLLVAAAAGIGGYALYKQSEKQASTAPVPGTPVPVYGPNGAIIGYVTPTGIYPNQAPGGPVYVPPSPRAAAGEISTAGCIACGQSVQYRRGPYGELEEHCLGCESDYRRMRHLTHTVALAGAMR